MIERGMNLQANKMALRSFSKSRQKQNVIILKAAIKMSKEEINQDPQQKLQHTDIQLFLNQIHPSKSKSPSALALIHNHQHIRTKHITVQHLKQVGFQTHTYKIKELIAFSVSLLETNQFAKSHLCDKTLNKLVHTIAVNYNSVAYHNFTHAFTLCLVADFQCLARQLELKSLYTEEEQFYILVAALSHDLNHKGTNNNFQIKSNSQLAQQTHGQSVLQTMHIRTLWKILQENPDINFLQYSTDKPKARKIITRLIMNTDMAFHFKNLQNIRSLRINGQLNPQNNQLQKWTLMQQIFHACDIGNPTSSYDNYISWAALLSFQFNQQTHLQEKMGLEITQSFIYHDLTTLYRDQVGFLGTIVQPLWKEISLIYPALSIYSDNVERNLERVTNQLQKLRR